LYFLLRAGPINFPRLIKELKELRNDAIVSLIGNDTNNFNDRRELRESPGKLAETTVFGHPYFCSFRFLWS
jgi:hypothetical protein